ncbi:sulfur transport domain-containing protein [Sarocladium implicatum]|nr:sulfur transport domain-containing protein [Sarocladium implicatum]
MATTLLCGAAFGASLLLSSFHQPVAIISQLRLENFHMAQAFITASAASAIVYPILKQASLVPTLQPRSSSPLLGLLSTYDGNILGGAMLGAGMALASACPGTLLVQTAVGVRAGAVTLVGSILGGVIWTGFLKGAIKTRADSRQLKSQTSKLEHVLGTNPEAMVLLFETMCVAIVGAVVAYTDKPPWAVYPGFIGGLFIGAAQLFSLLTRGSMMGISGSYEEAGNFITWFLRGQPSESRPTGYKNIIFALGGILGAWLLKVVAPQLVSEPVGHIPDSMALLGGILMTVGSRMAGGCTSGHGISGLSLMSTSSAVTIASTFAGGILVARLI